MDQLIMLSILFATISIPAFFAYRYPAREGLRMTLFSMVVFTAIYYVLLSFIAPKFIF